MAPVGSPGPHNKRNPQQKEGFLFGCLNRQISKFFHEVSFSISSRKSLHILPETRFASGERKRRGSSAPTANNVAYFLQVGKSDPSSPKLPSGL
jgi:hypothetical protein